MMFVVDSTIERMSVNILHDVKRWFEKIENWGETLEGA